MNLRDFVRETLVDIALAINEAKIEVKDFVAIVPGTVDGERVDDRMNVNFDIAVTVSEKNSVSKNGTHDAKAEIKVMGASLGGGVGKESANESINQKENVSRIQFEIPINLTANYKKNADAIEEMSQLLKTKIKERSAA